MARQSQCSADRLFRQYEAIKNMSNLNFVVTYVQQCTGGKLALTECGPVWQMGVIAVLLVAAVAFLIGLRLHGHAQSARG